MNSIPRACLQNVTEVENIEKQLLNYNIKLYYYTIIIINLIIYIIAYTLYILHNVHNVMLLVVPSQFNLYNAVTVFQLGIFPRALRPARTVLRTARFTQRPAQKNYIFFLQNVIAVFVFSDSRCKNACKMLADLCPCFHQSPTKLCPYLVSFMFWIVTKFWLSRA